MGIGYGDSPTIPGLAPYQTRYSRTPYGWGAWIEHAGWKQLIFRGHDAERIENYEDHLAEPAEGVYALPARAVMMSLLSGKYEETGLGEAIGRFFPGIPDTERGTSEYPIPLSNAFWHQYSESLWEFRWAMQYFKTMMDNLSHVGPWEQLHPIARGMVMEGREQLHSLLSFSPALHLNLLEGSFTPQWTFPSLLAVSAYELWQKLVGGNSIRHCKRARCRRIFLAAQYNREYLSDRCRQAEEKARQRRRNQARWNQQPEEIRI